MPGAATHIGRYVHSEILRTGRRFSDNECVFRKVVPERWAFGSKQRWRAQAGHYDHIIHKLWYGQGLGTVYRGVIVATGSRG